MAEREDITLGKVTVSNSLEFASGATATLPSGTSATFATATITTASLTAAPTITGTVASSVTIFLKDGSGNAVLARCATTNIPTGAGYAKGCILIATDGTNQTNTLFANIGSATTANFNAVTIAAD